jgi:hypothetical protein
MASQNRPASNKQAPDPASSYGREKPENESGAGRLDNDVTTPANEPDQAHKAVENKSQQRQINAHQVDNQRGSNDRSAPKSRRGK